MKSRTSLFNPTAFKKDITRFAPAWVLYTVGLFMILTVVMMDDSEYYHAASLADSLGFMASVNLCYGFLNGQLLFGDLFSARHCNALHAMPLRRECWFATHMVSGLLFALVPNALMMLVALPMLGSGWQVALWWYLASGLEYLFFFGLAALSALCVGNRFAMTLVYGIVNFFAVIVYWFYYTIYEPLLYGVFITEEPFVLFCPVWQMIDNYEVIHVARAEVEHATYSEWFVESVALGEGWGYLAICAVVGVALAGLALLLYRRRKLESAGDFMAVRALEPVFLVLYTMSMAAGFQVFAELFGVNEYVFLALGLIVGFFTARMLLMRTTKVFQAKGFIGFGILAAAFAASMLLTSLDPLGVTRYVPDTDDIGYAKISNNYDPERSDTPILQDEADLETVRQIHKLAVENPVLWQDSAVEYHTLSILYHMKNGPAVTRRYAIPCNSQAGELAKTLYTRADFVLGTDDAEAFTEHVQRVYFDQYKADGEGVSGEIYMNHTNDEYIRGLVDAIMADCNDGTMAQNYSYHETEEQYGWVEFSLAYEAAGDSWYSYRNITIYPSNRHTVAYLEANPFPVEGNYG